MDGYIPESFPHFYTNPTIARLGRQPRWAVSGQLTPGHGSKAPIDVRMIRDDQVLRGVTNPHAQLTLDELTATLPTATNNAFYVSSQTDQVMILDIEANCPDPIKRSMMELPYLYSEVSMSGRGIHLVMPMPANLNTYPVAMTKSVLAEEHKWYEILLDHWITFTRIPVEGYPVVATNPTLSWENVYASLAMKAIETVGVQITVENDKPEIFNEDLIVSLITKTPYEKTIKDFNGDTSAWEFGTIGYLNTKLTTVLMATNVTKGHTYDANDRAWLLYLAATKVLPWRAKHDTARNQMPWLLYCSSNLLSQDMKS